MKTIKITVPDNEYTRRVMQYLSDHVATEEIRHWNDEYNESPQGSEEEVAALGMLKAWESLEEKLVKGPST